MNAIDVNVEEVGKPLEYKIFALCFKEEGAISFFAEQLDPEIVGAIHGETGTHEFYKAILAFYHTVGADPIDPIAFRSWLEESEIFTVLGGDVGVRAFIDFILDCDTPDKLQALKLIKSRANKRKQINAIQELQQIINSKSVKSEKDHQRLTELTDEIRGLQQELDVNPLDFVTTGKDMVQNVEALLDIPSFLPTQFPSLNRAMGYSETGGFYRGAVHTILAGSGMGKSTFAKSLCNNWLDQGYTVLFINYEEAQNHWERILFTQIIGKNVYKEADSWSDEDRDNYAQKYVAKLEEWGNRIMARHDPDSAYFDDLELWFKDIIGSNENLPDVVVIDTIQSMFTKGSGKPRWAEFEQMMVRLEKLAKDMDCVLIITAQQNANALREKREVINQSDTGGSLSIQQKSSITIFITPMAQEESENAYVDTTLMQLQIPKNRITGGAYTMDPPIVKYDDDTKSYVAWEFASPDHPAIIEESQNLREAIHSL